MEAGFSFWQAGAEMLEGRSTAPFELVTHEGSSR